MINKSDKKKSSLYIVHCVDTEGPLKEPLSATFERLKALYNIEIECSEKNLKLIQEKKINLNGKEDEVAKAFGNHLLNYKDSWEKIDTMLDNIMSTDFRNKYKDSNGQGLIYNWHCLDHVGYETNERFRDLGFGKVFEFYKRKIESNGNIDKIHWHFHPVSFFKEAHICSTSYDNSYPIIHQILCRRLIDHSWFPVVNRAGFHSIRQDSNFFLEQWIPFDYSNQSTYVQNDNVSDVHRFGDWRKATKEWYPYHPSYDDYQIHGKMNRYTTKCLNIGTRYKLLTNFEIEMAFKDSLKNGSSILSFTNHDFREMSTDIEDVHRRINEVSKLYPNVSIIHADAIKAMQQIIQKNESIDPKIELELELSKENEDYKIIVKCISGQVFGSQPYLAIKTKKGEYFHDNFTETYNLDEWEYILDRITIERNSIEKISVASNDKFCNQSIKSILF